MGSRAVTIGQHGVGGAEETGSVSDSTSALDPFLESRNLRGRFSTCLSEGSGNRCSPLTLLDYSGLLGVALFPQLPKVSTPPGLKAMIRSRH